MIINYLLNLFSKNVKDNFVVGVTNCMPDSKKDIPNIINSLSDKDHFYYQNILKNDKLSRKEIIESDWYFTSDNKIISENDIEGNAKEKIKWEYTESQIKNFIENKIKFLERKTIKDSYDVLNNRLQLQNEINSFTDKINKLISKRSVYESNSVEQKTYKKLIIETRDKIDKNNSKREILYQSLKEINNALPFVKTIINKLINTENYNLICEKCHFNCHKNCNCKWFCDAISFYGKCKICNHGITAHKRAKYIYSQKEESERFVNNDVEELKECFKFLSEKKEITEIGINDINEYNNYLQKTLDNLYRQENKCNEEIENYKEKILEVEIEIIKTINNISNNLDYLRKNALNKESKTINIFIDDYKKDKEDKQKFIIEELYEKYNNLKDNENNIDKLTIDQYKIYFKNKI